MCDTIGFSSGGTAFFAKNSDRSANEPQVLRYFPPAIHREKTLRTTYLSVDQVRETHGLILSQPTWLWGGEMGVNDCGVCIGNEAVFTRGRYQKTGLIGMDMLRLALERGETAGAAVSILLDLLAHYGQGGNCGYDHDFYYDNSFLVIDRSELYVLETAGRHWVYRRTPRAAISNRLSIGRDGSVYDDGKPYDFRARFSDPLYTTFSGSGRRGKMTSAALYTATDAYDCMRILRGHAPDVKNPFAAGSVKSPCMHAGGIVGDHTTASLVVELGDRMHLYATGSSTPCLSLYKPVAFGQTVSPLFAPGDPTGAAYWYARERFMRSCIGKIIPAEYYLERDTMENGWLHDAAYLSGAALKELCIDAAEKERVFYEKWSAVPLRPARADARFLRYWRDKTAVLEREAAGDPAGEAAPAEPGTAG